MSPGTSTAAQIIATRFRIIWIANLDQEAFRLIANVLPNGVDPTKRCLSSALQERGCVALLERPENDRYRETATILSIRLVTSSAGYDCQKCQIADACHSRTLLSRSVRSDAAINCYGAS